MTILFILFFLLFIFSIFVGGIVWKIVSQTLTKRGEFGLNLSPVRCPQCGVETVLLRPPTLQQPASWGGGACSNCRCEMDKWGNEVLELTEKERIDKQLEDLKITPFKTFDKDGKTPLERVFDENK